METLNHWMHLAAYKSFSIQTRPFPPGGQSPINMSENNSSEVWDEKHGGPSSNDVWNMKAADCSSEDTRREGEKKAGYPAQ